MAETATYPLPRRSDGPSKPYVGNAPILDDELRATATIIAVEKFVKNEGTKDEWTAHRWILRSDGTLREWYWSELTGQKVRPADKDGKLNALTELLVRLGMRQMDALEAEEVPLDALKPAIGKVVRFQTRRKDNYYRVDIDSLSSVEP
jgi:hypothetical protein